MADLALQISTQANRRPFTINGATYYLLDAAELSIAEQLRLASIGEQYERIESLDTSSEEYRAAIAGLSAALDDAVRSVTSGIPDDVFSALSDLHKTQIIEVFAESFTVGRQEAGESVRNWKPSPASLGSTTPTRSV